MRFVSVCILSIIYGVAGAVSKVFRKIDIFRKKECSVEKILVIGTFHNPNWFYSHITPLARSGVGKVILVCDEPIDMMDNIVYECPPHFLSKICSRAGAKFLWTIVCGIRHKPDLYMGYHIFPAAIVALVVSKIFNRPCCYQCTSGCLELEGGGWNAENRLLKSLKQPSVIVEKIVALVVREFDLVVVRGDNAKKYIRSIGFKRKLEIITGSIEKHKHIPGVDSRDIDMIFVGRLSEIKRPERFVDIVNSVKDKIPEIKSVMVGDGEEKVPLIEQIEKLQLERTIQLLGKRSDVPNLLLKSKIFLLTSRSEGLSIAMIEAMAAGTVPVVSDVGELNSMVTNSKNGYIIGGDCVSEFSGKIIQLLVDKKKWAELSSESVKIAVDNSNVDVIANRWKKIILSVCDEY